MNRASRPTPGRLCVLTLCVMLALISGCASKRGQQDADNAPTLKTLSGREIDVPEDKGIQADVGDAIAAYRKFLEVAPKAQQRTEAMRRLGDLEMDAADNRLASGNAATPDYKAAIARYEEFLKEHPLE